MSDLARQVAAKIERRYIGGADDDPLVIAERKLLAEMIEADGVLVSHEDAELLRQVKCRDPLTLEKAVEVMGREPDHVNRYRGYECGWWGIHPDTIKLTKTGGKMWLEMGGTDYLNPTVGQFACLVLAAKMGEQA